MSVAPPRPKGPPLNALRAFEAAARLGGFAAAAEELFVTPGAVAQQVRALEDWAGAPLFVRRPQGVTLSPLGREAAKAYGAAFDVLGAATHSLRAAATPDVVRIATLPGLAQLWLSPRLPDIRAQTGAALSVSAVEAPPNLNRAHYDLALFFEPAEGAASLVDLGADEVFPVCAPALAEIVRRDGLSAAARLTDAAWAADWPLWTGDDATTESGAEGAVFSLYALVIDEAVAGAGVMMGHEHLVRALIAGGRLAAPFDRRVRTGRRLTLSVAANAGPCARAAARRLADGWRGESIGEGGDGEGGGEGSVGPG